MGIKETAKGLRDAVVPEGDDGRGRPEQQEGESDADVAQRKRDAEGSAASTTAATTSAAIST